MPLPDGLFIFIGHKSLYVLTTHRVERKGSRVDDADRISYGSHFYEIIIVRRFQPASGVFVRMAFGHGQTDLKERDAAEKKPLVYIYLICYTIFKENFLPAPIGLYKLYWARRQPPKSKS